MMSLVRCWLFPALLLLASHATAQTLQAEDAWVRAGPPASQVMAGYLTLHNNGAEMREIVSASSPAFEHIEMHQTRMEDGMARMIPQSSLQVPPGGSLVLEPGGYHLMLFNPVAPLAVDDVIEVTLTDSLGRTLSFSAPVRMPDSMDHGHHHHEHHH